MFIKEKGIEKKVIVEDSDENKIEDIVKKLEKGDRI